MNGKSLHHSAILWRYISNAKTNVTPIYHCYLVCVLYAVCCSIFLSVFSHFRFSFSASNDHNNNYYNNDYAVDVVVVVVVVVVMFARIFPSQYTERERYVRCWQVRILLSVNICKVIVSCSRVSQSLVFLCWTKWA